MPGEKITDNQVAIYMENKKNGHTQKIAAAKAGFSERSAKSIDGKKHWTQKDRGRSWRTHKDAFVEVWTKEVVPMLERGASEASFIFEEVQKKHPNKFPDSMLRTFQRRVEKWKALSGPGKEVMFRQDYEPGKLGISDFTHPDDIKVTINDESLEHIFYHFRLPYSKFNYMQVFRGSGEPYDAFAQGLQEALRASGGVPEEHRTDSLSASFKNLNKSAMEDLTERYKALIEHYDMLATRNNPGEAHENGAIEASHGHLKKRIKQSLIARGSIDFASLEEYRNFVHAVVRQHNRKSSKLIAAERAVLRPLPAGEAMAYTEVVAKVNSTSTISIKRVTYSVPSRLIGEVLLCRLYNDKIECYLGSVHTITRERMSAPKKGQRTYKIDYRDLIGSLVKKPGAFQGARLRDAILPNDDYRYIWKHVRSVVSAKDSCKLIVGLLHLAATYNCEEELAQNVIARIENKEQLSLVELQNKFNKHKQAIPIVHVSNPQLSSYNDLIPNYNEGQL